MPNRAQRPTPTNNWRATAPASPTLSPPRVSHVPKLWIAYLDLYTAYHMITATRLHFSRNLGISSLEDGGERRPEPLDSIEDYVQYEYPSKPLTQALVTERTAQANIRYHTKQAAIWQNRVDEWNLNGSIEEAINNSERLTPPPFGSSEDKSSEDNRQFHIQANQTTFYNIQHKLDLKKKELEELIKPRELRILKWDEIYQWDPPRNVPPPNENDRQQLATSKGSLTRYASTLRILEKYNERKDRQIGHLAFLQSFTLSPRQLGYFRDWALIELDLSKFSRAPDNKVALNLPGEIANPIGLLFPEQELVLPNADTTSPKFVAKRGATTGLTVGQMSAIEAVVRRPGHGEDKDVFAWELLIIPGSGPRGEVNVADRFSYKGDSGSAIFDSSGTIVGIVTAGNGSGDWRGVPDKQTSSSREYRKLKGGLNIAPQDADKTPTSERVGMPIGTDITFAHPIKWVSDDIEEFTGQKVQLA
ncbi:hypothetical protein F4859DRAFT_518168 [Xylaria cf. heliscus]|nr:hypothetical protein F4859DRAFT_518168 [Xylaria cf. heliscus]